MSKLTLGLLLVAVFLAVFTGTYYLLSVGLLTPPPATQVAQVGLGGGMTTSGWEPPIGIPRPDFGIDETYRMYDNPAIRNPALIYTQNAEGGFYTHYVDNTNPSCTDTNNDGTAGRPRCTIPGTSASPVPVGSVVELHGTYNRSHSSPNGIWASGSVSQPVFIRGANQQSRPTVTKNWQIRMGSYLIVENLDFDGARVSIGESKYISVRHSEFHNVKASQIGVSGTLDAWVEHVVLYDNFLHDNGAIPWDEQPDRDPDNHGISVGGYVRYIWVLDNSFARIAGNGMQVNGGSSNDFLHHVYFGRNVGTQTRQPVISLKASSDVVISQNIMHALRQIQNNSSTDGSGVFAQYDPDRIWVLYNEIFDADHGVFLGSKSTVMIGNLIHSIHRTSAPGKMGFAIAVTGNGTGVRRTIAGNTIYDVDTGIYVTGGDPLRVVDNIVDQVNLNFNGPNYYSSHIHISRRSETETLMAYNLMYQNGDPVKIRWLVDGNGNAYDLPQFRQRFPDQGEGSLNVDPKFVDATGSDFHLQSTSPAIDSGIFDAVYDDFYNSFGIDIKKDIEGNSRPQGLGWDIGAYEYTGGNQQPPTNRAPAVNAGIDQTITLPDPATLDGTVTDDGLPNPPGRTTTAWSKVSGPGAPGNPSFTNPNAVDTSATFTAPGAYVLRLTADDSLLQTSDDLQITVNPAGPRQPICGNNIREGNEQCDGPDLNNRTCQLEGYPRREGTLSCYPPGHQQECRYDFSACSRLPRHENLDGQTTDFRQVPDLRAVRDAVLERSAYGQIFFQGQTLDFERLDLDSIVQIADKLISVDSTNYPRFRVPARLRFYHLTLTDPQLFRDGVLCTACTRLTYENGTATFQVPSFSDYQVTEGNQTPPPPPANNSNNNSSGGGGGGFSRGSSTPPPVTPSGPGPSLPRLFGPYGFGQRGESVRDLQRVLAHYLNLAPDLTTQLLTGVYDDATILAVRKAQRSLGIEATGIAGPLTRSALNSRYATPTVPGTLTPAQRQTLINQIRTLIQQLLDQVTVLLKGRGR